MAAATSRVNRVDKLQLHVAHCNVSASVSDMLTEARLNEIKALRTSKGGDAVNSRNLGCH